MEVYNRNSIGSQDPEIGYGNDGYGKQKQSLVSAETLIIKN
jgi:hypothetical protein